MNREVDRRRGTVHAPPSVFGLFTKCPQWLKLWMQFEAVDVLENGITLPGICEGEPSSDHVVYGVRELGYQMIWSPLYIEHTL